MLLLTKLTAEVCVYLSQLCWKTQLTKEESYLIASLRFRTDIFLYTFSNSLIGIIIIKLIIDVVID